MSQLKPQTTSLNKCCLNCTWFYNAFLCTCCSISVCVLRVHSVCLFILLFMMLHYQQAAGVFPDACIFQSSLRFTIKCHHPANIPCTFYCLLHVTDAHFASLTQCMPLTLPINTCQQQLWWNDVL